ncbi:MAG: rhamnan synthesis F family protein [Lachnospiraceae bacterium]|nr:rhamnan synthesis F family protein [Lachnospiraceae bacterium]MDE7205441.1 rhamnan synthesis F family protein [Lachnospiraceae bacterium]
MQNVYDELFSRGLIHIIADSQKDFKVPDAVYQDTAIAVNLFYEDTLQRYFEYLDRVPSSIEICIYTSNERAWEKISQYADGRENVFCLKKENRGRDISAFLVAFKRTALKKKFLCFLHDKKQKTLLLKEDTDYWIENLWDNTIHSETYINNILGLLMGGKIGILTPPIPFGERLTHWYTNRWRDDNFKLAEELAARLGLQCDIDRQKMPVTLGSVFWCRTKAITKLLEYDWKYEDFRDEPLPDDGTISHAIERIFAYVAQDAGYSTEWIMSSRYAGRLILSAQMQMAETYQMTGKNFGVRSLTELRRLDRQRKAIEKICSECKTVYLYGAGGEGRRFVFLMNFWKLQVDGFVVTRRETAHDMFLGIPVYEFDRIIADETVGVIITVGLKFCDEIEEIVKKREGVRYYVPAREEI